MITFRVQIGVAKHEKTNCAGKKKSHYENTIDFIFISYSTIVFPRYNIVAFFSSIFVLE